MPTRQERRRQERLAKKQPKKNLNTETGLMEKEQKNNMKCKYR